MRLKHHWQKNGSSTSGLKKANPETVLICRLLNVRNKINELMNKVASLLTCLKSCLVPVDSLKKYHLLPEQSPPTFQQWTASALNCHRHTRKLECITQLHVLQHTYHSYHGWDSFCPAQSYDSKFLVNCNKNVRHLQD